ncbi:MAG: B12-binding domain-containing radical SAM protein [Candidatus Riflebacteria bacterium]|nr:B12-binding domain-containing radical SAM protein [Candidatus Riflebacteria bacterium]
MKILLIQPSGAIHRFRVGNFPKSLRYAPLTLTTLAALVPSELNIEVEICDEGVQLVNFSSEPDLVAMTIITGTAKRGYAIADYFRKRKIPVVIGGVHATLCPDEAQKHADCVVAGFGEISWPQLLRDFKNGKMRERYTDLKAPPIAKLPWPRRELLRKEGYITTSTTWATRGCLNECDFCSIPATWGNNFYKRPVEDVVSEIASLPGKEFVLVDPSPMEDPDHAKILFKEIGKLKKKWFGLSTTKIGKDPELLKIVGESGCQGLLIGFESVNQMSIGSIGKDHNSVDFYLDLVKRMHDHGMGVQACFVFGLDDDKPDIFKRTVDFCDTAHVDLPRFSTYTPFPNTGAYRKLDEQKRIISYDWALYDVEHIVVKPLQMTVKQLEDGLLWAWNHAYRLASLAKRLLGSRTSIGYALSFNLGYRYYASRLNEMNNKVLFDDVNEGIPQI